MTVTAGHININNRIMLPLYVVMHPESQDNVGSCLCGHHSELLAKRKLPLQALLLNLACFVAWPVGKRNIKAENHRYL